MGRTPGEGAWLLRRHHPLEAGRRWPQEGSDGDQCRVLWDGDGVAQMGQVAPSSACKSFLVFLKEVNQRAPLFRPTNGKSLLTVHGATVDCRDGSRQKQELGDRCRMPKK